MEYLGVGGLPVPSMRKLMLFSVLLRLPHLLQCYWRALTLIGQIKQKYCALCALFCFLKKSLILGLHNLQLEIPPLHSHSVFLLPLLRMMRRKMKSSVSINLVQVNM